MRQITIRGLIASVAIRIIYSLIVMKVNLTTGLIPNLNVSAALLVFIRTWTKLLHKAGIVPVPFTRQENTVIQTCAVACYSIAVGGGFGSYSLGLNHRTYELTGVDTPGNTKEPQIGCADCNRKENILSWHRFLKPRITFGVSIEEMVGGERSVSTVKTLLKLYLKEKYILVIQQQKHQELEFLVSFKVGATSVSVLRSVWQAYWLSEKWDSESDIYDQLGHSLVDLENNFENFIQQLDEAGWDTQQINLKVPKSVCIEEELGPV